MAKQTNKQTNEQNKHTIPDWNACDFVKVDFRGLELFKKKGALVQEEF